MHKELADYAVQKAKEECHGDVSSYLAELLRERRKVDIESDVRSLAEATKDAQHRGQILVEATGAHLGGLRGVDVGVFQVTSPNSTEVEDYGVYDTSTLDKDVTAVVNVTFALK